MNLKQGQDNLKKGTTAADLVKNREVISKLAKSSDAQKLMSILNQQGGVKEAAKAAADGDPSALMSMMDRLMRSQEGAELVDRIGRKAKEAGLELRNHSRVERWRDRGRI